MMCRRYSVAIAIAVALVACGGATGDIRGEHGPVPDWTLHPNRCRETQPAGLWWGGAVADLYYAGVHTNDTELVVRPSGTEPTVLIRIPDRANMVVLRRRDCTVFDIVTDGTSYEVNDAQGMTGHVRLDCTRPEIGHVTGAAEFTCF